MTTHVAGRHAATRRELAAPRRHMRHGWRTAATAVSWAVLAALMALVVGGAIVPRAMGAVPLAVLSGSMRPTLEPGDLIVVKPANGVQSISVGEVITFQPVAGDPTLVTHRVVAIHTDNGQVTGLTTRGDANGADDKPIVPAQVMGTVAYSIPKVGYLAHAMQQQRGWLVLVVAGALFAYSGFALVTGALARRGAHNRIGPVT